MAEFKVSEAIKSLEWYVREDDTNQGQDSNRYWLEGKQRAIEVIRSYYLSQGQEVPEKFQEDVNFG